MSKKFHCTNPYHLVQLYNETSKLMAGQNTNAPKRDCTNRFRGDTETPLSTGSKTYKGDTPEISVVLALCTEKINKKFTYDTFCNKLRNYIMKTLVNGEDVVVVPKDMNLNHMDV